MAASFRLYFGRAPRVRGGRRDDSPSLREVQLPQQSERAGEVERCADAACVGLGTSNQVAEQGLARAAPAMLAWVSTGSAPGRKETGCHCYSFIAEATTTNRKCEVACMTSCTAVPSLSTHTCLMRFLLFPCYYFVVPLLNACSIMSLESRIWENPPQKTPSSANKPRTKNSSTPPKKQIHSYIILANQPTILQAHPVQSRM